MFGSFREYMGHLLLQKREQCRARDWAAIARANEPCASVAVQIPAQGGCQSLRGFVLRHMSRSRSAVPRPPNSPSCRTVEASLQSRWWRLLGARRRWPGSAESSCMVETTSFAASPTSYSAGLPCAMLLLLVSTSVTLACFASTADDGTRGATARSGTLRVSSRHKPIMRAVAAIHPTSVKSCSARASLAVLPPAA